MGQVARCCWNHFYWFTPSLSGPSIWCTNGALHPKDLILACGNFEHVSLMKSLFMVIMLVSNAIVRRQYVLDNNIIWFCGSLLLLSAYFLHSSVYNWLHPQTWTGESDELCFTVQFLFLSINQWWYSPEIICFCSGFLLVMECHVPVPCSQPTCSGTCHIHPQHKLYSSFQEWPLR